MRLLALSLVFALAAASHSEAQTTTSYIEYQKSESSTGCFGSNPTGTYYTYATVTVYHRINCPVPGGGTQQVTLGEQSHSTQYTSACQEFGLSDCSGRVDTNTSDLGSQWKADLTTTNAYRSYDFSEYVCHTSSYYPTSFWFEKVTSDTACQ